MTKVKRRAAITHPALFLRYLYGLCKAKNFRLHFEFLQVDNTICHLGTRSFQKVNWMETTAMSWGACRWAPASGPLSSGGPKAQSGSAPAAWAALLNPGTSGQREIRRHFVMDQAACSTQKVPSPPLLRQRYVRLCESEGGASKMHVPSGAQRS